MTKQQFDDLYLGKAVHCDTEEKANKFLELAHGFGYKWRDKTSLLGNNYWDNLRYDTCYKVNSYVITYANVDLYKKSGYTIVKFELEKENNMKYKVGDTVRVRSGLKEGQLLGMHLETYHRKLENNVFTIAGVTMGGNYIVKGTVFILSDEMLEPFEETFNVGDVVYDKSGQRLEVIGFGVKVRTKHRVEFYRPQYVLTKTKPLQKITRKELAEKGYELVD